MILFAERLLVGLDDSEESWNAFDYALGLAKDLNLDKVTVVHSEMGGDETGTEEYRGGEEILEEAESRGEDLGVKVETHMLVRGYEPDVDIVKFAEEHRFNHIIVGSRGRSGIGRVLLGSIAEGIVEKAHCIVTVVRTAPFIRTRGEWVLVWEIESLLSEHEAVKEVSVIGVPDEELGEKPVAFIVPVKGSDLVEKDIQEHMKKFVEEGKIAETAIPSKVNFLEEMPKTSVGKIDKKALKSKYVK